MGLENLRIQILPTGKDWKRDENHAWNGVYFSRARDSWVRNVDVRGHGGHAFSVQNSLHVTFDKCRALESIAQVVGGRRYGFSFNNDAQLNLVKRSYATLNRHSFITNGATACSGNVFTFNKHDRVQSPSEAHRQFTQVRSGCYSMVQEPHVLCVD
eukprot:Colp12_sorted_trinity150504_noHs@1111